MDRQAWIAVTLCVIGLVVWQIYVAKNAPPPVPTAARSPSPSISASAAAVSASPTPVAAAAPSTSVAPENAAAKFEEKIETLRNGDEEVRLTNRGGAISEIVLLNHADDSGRPIILNSRERTPIAAIIDQPAAATLPEFAGAKQADGSIQFERTTPDRINVKKKFRLTSGAGQKDNYAIGLDVDLRNDGPQPYTSPGYYITLGSAKPIHANDYPSYTQLGWCVNGKAKFTDVSWFAEQNSFFGLQHRPARDIYEEKIFGAEWAAVSNQFFATILTPLNVQSTGVWGGRRFEIKFSETQIMYGLEGAMGMPGFQLKPGETSSLHFQIYGGPKLYHRLTELTHNEAEIMNFGIFKLISQALLNLLNLLHQYLGNYAAAILALTTIVKLTLWPLQNKANRSMRRMSALSPKMQELKEKYKDDPTRMNQEVMKLYKDYGINPVSGCLPMFIQIPIFFGLFTMLRQAVEMRNASFFWCHDLSQPDTIGHFPIVGWPINILPLLMALTNVWMMRITPKTGDATQQRVMMFTPIIFVVFCYNFAAALALYYTTQNLFTILQLYQNRKQPMPVLEKTAVANKRARKGR
jgi:YidC/Oxa1 family membrane protein insertase